MSDKKVQYQLFWYLLVPAVVTLTTASTAPWWWQSLFRPGYSYSETVQSSSIEPTPASSSINNTALDAERGVTSIEWDTNLHHMQIHDSVGQKFTFKCEGNGSLNNAIWGTVTYSGDSSICNAAVHSGQFSRKDGGVVQLQVTGMQTSFMGSQRFGVVSRGYGAFSSSFRFLAKGEP
ncbi:hypothetical protein IQ266_06045 [filamentous cyanobacterium LEGE 11480]|uniref:LCCL domain-containing protein n=1 Tax=Romeriopsis navalis LEGE 11480 TaxID=2777977 RepID=A0A928VIN9_9CYAN|nr:hypothetical protein [Romeriopsis navalis LEGE 11480]